MFQTAPGRANRGVRLGVLSLMVASVLIGCGGSQTDVDAQIARERDEAAAAAVQAERIEQLKEKVDDLESKKPKVVTKTKTVERPSSPPTPVAEPASTGSSSSRTFHAPSGNVSCEITAVTARCTVAAANLTFGFDSGAATKRSGSELPRSAGSRAEWGSTVDLGNVSCKVPREDEPRGVTCVNNSTGHGFEASRRPDRQQTY